MRERRGDVARRLGNNTVVGIINRPAVAINLEQTLGGEMIARIWHGRTSVQDYETYTEFLKERAIPDYQHTEGFVRLVFLRAVKEDAGHFTLITFWENLQVVKNFAGEDYTKAKYYPEDKNFLLEFEERVEHYEVFAEL